VRTKLLETYLKESLLTDQEFNEFFGGLSSEQILGHLGSMVHDIKFRSGNSYRMYNLDDLKHSIEQELYEKMTGGQ
jgi:hypothetical protein